MLNSDRLVRFFAKEPFAAYFANALKLMQRVSFLRNTKLDLERAIIRKLGRQFFDAEHYLEGFADADDRPANPLRHYLREGWHQDRDPHLFFDASYYISAIADYPGELNPIVHYILIGQGQKLSPTPWFDHAVYAERNSDVVASGIEPFGHFIGFGLHENRNAWTTFDPHGYLTVYPDAGESGLPALVHYVKIGLPEGRPGVFAHEAQSFSGKRQRVKTTPDVDGQTWLKRILALPRPAASKHLEAGIDIVVPVYKNFDLTMECLYQALSTTQQSSAAVVVINDCSPEPELSAALQKIADAGRITLCVNVENQGFVRSVNTGMRLNAGRDIVLLNSDAMVYDDWIERLQKTANRDSQIASITPLTNSGTICSYPVFLEDNTDHFEVNFAELDKIASRVNSGEYVDAPTGVGFCMFIKRAALDEVGYFDEEAFGTGYGEENDFCLRCQNKGWLDVIATDVFVHHVGGASFQSQKPERVRNAMTVIGKRYPSYHADVGAYCTEDPARTHRARIDMARLRRQVCDRNVLIVSHDRGGGTEQHIQERVAQLNAEGASVFRLGANGNVRHEARLFHNDVWDVPNLPAFDLTVDDFISELAKLLHDLEITEVDIHHIGDFPPDAAELILELVRAADLKFQFTAHDYLPICPRTNLVDAAGHYCGEPNDDGCNQCLRSNGSDYGVEDIAKWREGYSNLLQAADRIVVPDLDVRTRMSDYFHDVEIDVVPHDAIVQASMPPRSANRGGRPFRIGVIGAISSIKGLDVIQRAAKQIRTDKLDLQFVVVGFTSNDIETRACGIEVTGKYENSEVQSLINESLLDAILLPSVWPETFSYTLSIALETGLPIIGFDIGAIARRLETSERSLILPLATAKNERRFCRHVEKYMREFYPSQPVVLREVKTGTYSA